MSTNLSSECARDGGGGDDCAFDEVCVVANVKEQDGVDLAKQLVAKGEGKECRGDLLYRDPHVEYTEKFNLFSFFSKMESRRFSSQLRTVRFPTPDTAATRFGSIQ